MKKFFAESGSVRYKDLFQAKTIFGVLDTLTEECEGDMKGFWLNLSCRPVGMGVQWVRPYPSITDRGPVFC